MVHQQLVVYGVEIGLKRTQPRDRLQVVSRIDLHTNRANEPIHERARFGAFGNAKCLLDGIPIVTLILPFEAKLQQIFVGRHLVAQKGGAQCFVGERIPQTFNFIYGTREQLLRLLITPLQHA